MALVSLLIWTVAVLFGGFRVYGLFVPSEQDSGSFERILMRAGVYSPEERDLFVARAALASLYLAFISALVLLSVLPFSGVPLALNSLFGGVAVSLFAFPAVIQLFVRTFHEQIALFLPVVAEQLRLASFQHQSFESGLKMLVRVSVERHRFNPLTGIFARVLADHEQGIQLPVALRMAADEVGQRDLKALFSAISQCLEQASGNVSKQIRFVVESVLGRELAPISRVDRANMYGQLYRTLLFAPLQASLLFSGLGVSPFHFRIAQLACFLITVVLAVLYTPPVLLLIPLMLLLPFLPNFMLAAYNSTRTKDVLRALTHFTDRFVGLLRGGMDAEAALTVLHEELEPGSPIQRELEAVFARLKRNPDMRAAFSGFCADVPVPEVELFLQILLITGMGVSDIAEALVRCNDQIRKRYLY